MEVMDMIVFCLRFPKTFAKILHPYVTTFVMKDYIYNFSLLHITL